ncbi:MAG: hypothetical protein C4557_11075 [Anaerolineaceae bacterium]|jgi:hypothetical protein|nr:MAG: hypothetical protein C4557_11075 [Anaerolineaceae bacterium]
MRKMIYASLFALSLLIFTVNSVFAAPQKGTVIGLVEVRNDSQGGVIFVFKVSGRFPKSDLNNGSVSIQGGDGVYGLHCNQVDEETVQCSTSRKTGGQNVVVVFGGSVFFTKVPERSEGRGGFCYPVYDWDLGEPPTFWQHQGNHCQEGAAKEGDQIYFYSPYWQSSYYYIFHPNGFDYSGWENPGQGYYYEEEENPEGSPE